ncbi:hypothetical protein FRC01_002318 [Tulasnella sp. 417]|nr:hypothetical protein FRC01_002318 [Tulasnella sp. 417]
MAHPSSSHRDRDRDDDRGTTRERTHRTSSSTHHHRTISSTTLLLVLSLILAVLAVMLSLPSRSGGGSVLPAGSRNNNAAAVADVHTNDQETGLSHSFWGYLTPKRSHDLVARETEVALREAEVARREAELLAGRPGGWGYACPVCGESVVEEIIEAAPAISVVQRATPPAPPAATHTIIKEIEVIKEVEPTNPAWLQDRIESILQRELKMSDREKDVGQREETVGKRESDATKRESWIIDQLQKFHAEPIEEVVYDEQPPRHYYGETRRAAPPPKFQEIPVPPAGATQPPPAPTRVAARPTPETYVGTPTAAGSGKTTEIYVEVPTPVYMEPDTVTIYETRSPKRGQWW